MTKKATVLMALMCTISSVFGQEKAKEPTKETPTKTDKPDKKSGGISTVYSVGYAYRRDVVLSAGIAKKGWPVKIEGNFSFPRTSFGGACMFYPLRFVGVGAEAIYFYKSDVNLYSEFFFGGKVANTFKDPKGRWQTKRFVCSPIIELSIPFEKWRIGSKANIVYGFWDFDGKGWGLPKRWYDFTFFISFSPGWTVEKGSKKDSGSGKKPETKSETKKPVSSAPAGKFGF